jgi:DNA polymerase III subunit delta
VPELAPVYLICGSDRPKVRRAAARLRSRVEGAEGTVESFDATEATPAEVGQSCLALGLFGGRRLVLVQAVESWPAATLGPIEAIIADPTPDTTLALVAGPSLRADSRLRKLVPAESTLAYDLPKGRELPAYLRREAERLGATLTPEALERVLELVGERPEALAAELDKLATYARGDVVDVGAVESLVIGSGSVVPWSLTDAVTSRRPRVALRELGRSLAAGGRPQPLVPELARHFERLRRARLASDAGSDAKSFARATGMHDFPARKLLQAAHRWEAPAAAAAVARLARADHETKGGSRLDPGFALERALADAMPPD